MEKALEDLQHAMATIRTGRASVHLLDNVRVDYYGTPTPVNQVANLHVPEPGMITIQPWDVSQIGPIEKAIRAADLGVNPVERRQDHPHSDSAADRRAPQGAGQKAARRGRGSSRGDPQHPPRFERSRQEAGEGKEDHRRRRSPRARRNAEADRRLHAEARSGRAGERKRNSGNPLMSCL